MQMTDSRLGTPTASVEERRALDAEEWQLADMTRAPAIQRLDDAELTELIWRLRERRNRARELADRQAREARWQADPAGAISVRSDAGMRRKHGYLAEALERAKAEQGRRAKVAAEEVAARGAAR